MASAATLRAAATAPLAAPRQRAGSESGGEIVTNRKYLPVAGALLLASTAPVLAQVIAVGPNVDINRQTGYQAEDSISIDPTNPNRMFAWSNDLGARNSAAFSLDGG